MTEFERQILDRLIALESAVNSLRSEFTISQITFFENLSPFAIVGADYVSYRFGCSQDAVIRGRFETDRIPKIRKKPIGFRKSDVDAVWQNLNVSTSDKAAELRHKANKKNGRN